jgi:hypothetical protein
MSEFYLCHIALVGARISTFQEYGYNTRNDLSLCRVVPDTGNEPLSELPAGEVREMFARLFPVWVHNIISDPDFPLRHKLEMPLRRFEGELKDSKENETISAVLSAGFKSQTLDPSNLPSSMPLRQRCAMVAHIDAWQDAYSCLEQDIIAIMMTQLEQIDKWMKLARNQDQEMIEYMGKSA